MRRAFTLVELLVVVSVLGLLAGLLLPAVQAAREAARDAQCKSNLHQLGAHIQHYESIHGVLPMAWYDRSLEGVAWCPTCRETNQDGYYQMYSEIEPVRRIELMEQRQQPSDKIEVLRDSWYVHFKSANVLYLDGHVGSVTTFIY